VDEDDFAERAALMKELALPPPSEAVLPLFLSVR
jgi:hypothetical protein